MLYFDNLTPLILCKVKAISQGWSISVKSKSTHQPDEPQFFFVSAAKS
jgi:hypothetical protein